MYASSSILMAIYAKRPMRADLVVAPLSNFVPMIKLPEYGLQCARLQSARRETWEGLLVRTCQWCEALTHPLLRVAVYDQYAPPFFNRTSACGAIMGNSAFAAGNSVVYRIETQRPGADLVQAGIVRDDQEMMAAGWKVLNWGLTQQDRNGGFSGNGGGALGVAFFVEALSRALLTHQINWRAESATEQIDRLYRAADRLLRDFDAAIVRDFESCGHRLWLLAAGFAQTYAVAGGHGFAQAARRFASMACHVTGAEGVIRENGGYDVRYQTMGLLYAARYALLEKEVLCGELGAGLKRLFQRTFGHQEQTKDVVSRAAEWLVSRQGASGALNSTGSTRYIGKRDSSGTPKQIEYSRAVEALVLCAAVTNEKHFLDAASLMASRSARDIVRLRSETRAEETSLAFVFVCQSGEWEVKATLLAASLRRHVSPDVELIAAVPHPSAVWGQLSETTIDALNTMNVRRVQIENPIDASFTHANKIACLAVPIRARTLVFLDSDIICLGVPEPSLFRRQPVCAKVADLAGLISDSDWMGAYEAAGVAPPERRVMATVEGTPSMPFYNSGVLAVDWTLASVLSEVWAEYSRKVRARANLTERRLFSDQIGLAIALEKLGIVPHELETSINHPVHLVPLDPNAPPVFAHYHNASFVAQEPLLREAVCEFCEEYKPLRRLCDRHEGWELAGGSRLNRGAEDCYPEHDPGHRHITERDQLSLQSN